MSVTVPTFWLVLPVLAAVSAGTYFLVRWLWDRYADPAFKRWYLNRHPDITEAEFDEIAKRVR